MIKESGVLIELDALFDTRIATIRQYWGDEIADNVLLNGYWNRERDIFEGVDTKEFRRLYAERDLETLNKAFPTTLLFTINEIINFELVKPLMLGHGENSCSLIVNIWPYKISSEPLDEIVRCLMKVTSNKIPVKVINQPPEYLHVDYLTNSVTQAYMYDWNAWLSAHYMTLAKKKLIDCSIVGPRIYLNTLEEANEQLKEIEKDNQNTVETDYGIQLDNQLDSFDRIENLASMFCSFSFAEKRLFDQFIPDDFDLVKE